MTDKTPKKSTGRVAKLREENRKKGRVRREYYATPEEHNRLRATLEGLRKWTAYCTA